ncbi:TELO2-interacting protein 2-like isoform X3 [Branchiostoma lanceolatum]|uniref:TELO2-interacting protein 2-like isoform X3 n=1 Tax=Branchiostoma lanceolatum TaxID=7740 RepID=UPI003454532F
MADRVANLTCLLEQLRLSETSGDENRTQSDPDHVDFILKTYTVTEVLSELCTEIRKDVPNKVPLLDKSLHIFQQSSTCWLVPDGIDTETLSKQYVAYITSLLSTIQIPEQRPSEEEIVHDEDFANVKEVAPNVLKVICGLLKVLDRNDGSQVERDSQRLQELKGMVFKKVAPGIACGCIAFFGAEQPWSNDCCASSAQDTLSLIMRCCNFINESEMLCGSDDSDKVGVFGSILSLLKPSLGRDSWKKNLSTRQVFYWCVVRVARPYLSDYINSVLPPVLLFLDDHQLENRLLGVGCLQHVLKNTPAAELRWYNRAAVIYDALYATLYSQEPRLVEKAVPCLLDVCAVLEKAPTEEGVPQKVSQTDALLRHVLSNMQHEGKVAMRRAYCRHLHLIIQHMGIRCVRHLNRLLRVVYEYLEVYDGPVETARKDILAATKAMIIEAWLRMPHHAQPLAKALLKLVIDMSMDESRTPENVREEICASATECLVLLNRCCEGELAEDMRVVGEEIEISAVKKCVKTVLEDMENP